MSIHLLSQPRKAIWYFVLAYWIVTILGILLTIVFMVIFHPPSAQELEASLARLGRDPIDLYQHHFPVRGLSIPKLMDRLADAVEAGKVKAVGVSGYSVEQMREAHAALAKRGIPLASNQVEYSLLHRKPEVNGVLNGCRELGITLIAQSPLGRGARQDT